MKVLYTGFKGKNNTSKILLDKIDVPLEDKLYLTNSFTTSESELRKKLENTHYDLIVAIGQLKLAKNTVRIERFGRGQSALETTYEYKTWKESLEQAGFIVEESIKTNYLCNNIYYYGLNYIKENHLQTKMIFLHIPKLNLIDNIDLLAKTCTKV